MQGLDLGNSLFEGIGAALTWINVRRLLRDREIKGIDWRVTAFWAAWGLWNLVYYPSLGQWWSAAAGAVLVTGNLVWVWLAIRIKRTRSVPSIP